MTVFDKQRRIGGLWPTTKEDNGMVHPEMCTNQSRHTVSFSDLAWPETAPSFPKAWQVGKYLERYIKTYRGYEIKLNHTVVKAEHMNGRWEVYTQKGFQEPKGFEFDHVIVATGFFGKPKMPKILDGTSSLKALSKM